MPINLLAAQLRLVYYTKKKMSTAPLNSFFIESFVVFEFFVKEIRVKPKGKLQNCIAVSRKIKVINSRKLSKLNITASPISA